MFWNPFYQIHAAEVMPLAVRLMQQSPVEADLMNPLFFSHSVPKYRLLSSGTGINFSIAALRCPSGKLPGPRSQTIAQKPYVRPKSARKTSCPVKE